MKTKELRPQSAVELNTRLTDLHKEQFALRMQKATGQLAATHNAKRVRRDIARINTLLTEQSAQKTA